MSAYKSENNTWYTKFRYRNHKQEIKWVTKRGFSTKRDALKWEQDFLRQQSGDLGMSFREFADVYLSDISPRLKPSTLDRKKQVIFKKLVPYFGERPVNMIRATEIVQWQNTVLNHKCTGSGNGYAPQSLRNLHKQLSCIFNHAVRFYALPSNPARKAGSIGSCQGEEMKFWTKEEYLKFSQALEEKSSLFYAFEMLYWCGLRRGEMLALTKKDFNFCTKTVSITKNYYRLHKEDIITTPKTEKSYRKIILPDFLCEEMQEYFALFPLTEDERIFQFSTYQLYRHMKKCAEKAGVQQIRIHDLRHSHVSLLIDMGYSAVAIADRLGPYRYAHLFPSVQHRMAQQLNTARENEKDEDDMIAEERMH